MKRIAPLLLLLIVLALGAAACGGSDDSEASSDIVDTAVEAGSFTTLASLLEATGLDETLRSDGAFTVFAPTDDAFDALPEGTLDQLGQPENADQLEAILLYHVVDGEARSGDLEDGQAITTVQGSDVTIGIDDAGSVSVNDANVVSADVEASNGVIHAIDAVLLPSS